jgi:hypothetical protein
VVPSRGDSVWTVDTMNSQGSTRSFTSAGGRLHHGKHYHEGPNGRAQPGAHKKK